MYLHFPKAFSLCQPTYFNAPLSIMLFKLLFCSKLFKGSLFLNNKIQHLKSLFIICILLILFFPPPTYYFSHSPHFSFFSTLFFITAFLLRIPHLLSLPFFKAISTFSFSEIWYSHTIPCSKPLGPMNFWIQNFGEFIQRIYAHTIYYITFPVEPDQSSEIKHIYFMQ